MCIRDSPITIFAQGENLLSPQQLTGLLCLITAGYKMTCSAFADPMDYLIRSPSDDHDENMPIDVPLAALRADLRLALTSASPDLAKYIMGTAIPFFQAKGALDIVEQLARDQKLAPHRRTSAHPWQSRHIICEAHPLLTLQVLSRIGRSAFYVAGHIIGSHRHKFAWAHWVFRPISGDEVPDAVGLRPGDILQSIFKAQDGGPNMFLDGEQSLGQGDNHVAPVSYTHLTLPTILRV